MPGPVGTAVKAFERLVADQRERVTVRVHLSYTRCKNIIRPERSCEIRVGLEPLGVLVQILIPAELNRVQKHADNRNVAIFHGSLDKGTVAIV